MRRFVPKRRRIFIGAEGESERSLAKWLAQLCEEAHLHLHLDVTVCRGGDSLAVVSHSVKQYRKRSSLYGQYSAGLILLDDDRIEEDQQHGRGPLAGVGAENIDLVKLVPNFEGLLLRLHRDCENQFLSAQGTRRSLRRLWPGYDKPPFAYELGRRFQLQDLQRAAMQDANIQLILDTLGLSP